MPRWMFHALNRDSTSFADVSFDSADVSFDPAESADVSFDSTDVSLKWLKLHDGSLGLPSLELRLYVPCGRTTTGIWR